MNKAITISVIIPIFKRKEYAEEAIESVLKQEGVDQRKIEIILSEERDYGFNIRKQLKRNYPQVRTIENRFEEGPGGSRQTGLSIAKGKYIVFLDSDDQMKAGFLSRMVKVLEQNKKLGAVVCLTKPYFSAEFPIKEKIMLGVLLNIRNATMLTGYILNKSTLHKSAFFHCQVSHMIFRQSKIKDFKFNYDYRHGGEDWDLYRYVLEQAPIGVYPQSMVLFRYSPGSSTYSAENLQKKWSSYNLLLTRLPKDFKNGLFHWMLLTYIKSFGGKDVSK